jgi:hypothetical protein
MKRFEMVMLVLALIAVLIALLAWLVPFSPIGVSPLVSGSKNTSTPNVPSIPLNIRPACGTTYTIETGKAIELRYGTWYAEGLELAIDNAKHLSVTLFIDGRKIPAIQQPVQPVTASSYPGAECSPSRDYSNAFGIFYVANIGPFTSGEHSVRVIYSLDKQVTDGGYDENGNPVLYGPGELDPLEFIIVATP